MPSSGKLGVLNKGGGIQGRPRRIGNTAAVATGNFMILDSNGALDYVTPAASGDKPVCYTEQNTNSVTPTSDGDTSLLCWDDPLALIWVPIVTGTIALTHMFETCDLAVSGTTHGLDLSGSTDNCFFIIDINVSAQRALVRCDFHLGFATV